MASSLLSGIGCTRAPCLHRRGVIKLSRWRLSRLGVCCQPCLAPFERLLETLRRLTKPSPTVRNVASLRFYHRVLFFSIDTVSALVPWDRLLFLLSQHNFEGPCYVRLRAAPSKVRERVLRVRRDNDAVLLRRSLLRVARDRNQLLGTIAILHAPWMSRQIPSKREL